MNDTELDRLVEKARTRPIDDATREAQRINFAYGNAAAGDKQSTKKSVRAASSVMKNS